MKSKISFFNKHLFLKNVTLFAPLWAAYLIYLNLTVSLGIWVAIRRMKMGYIWSDEISINNFYRGIEGILSPSMQLLGTVVMAALTAMALYYYLYTAKSANMIHSLPVTRLELYGTNVASGLFFCWMPQIVTAITAGLVSVSNGQHLGKYLVWWLLQGIGIAALFTAIATLCAMLTGHLIAMPVYYTLANILVLSVSFLFSMILSNFAYGLSVDSFHYFGKFQEWMTPVANISIHTGLQFLYEKDGKTICGFSSYGEAVMVIYFFFSVVLYVLGWFAYKKRSLECAGDFVSFQFLRPVFKWGIGFAGGYLCAFFVDAVFETVGENCPLALFFMMDILFSVVFYFLSDMLLQKRVKVFGKKCIKPVIIFTIFMAAAYTGLYGAAIHEEKKVPEPGKVKRAYVKIQDYVEFTGDDINEVIQLQKEFVSRKENTKKRTEYVFTADISYLMEDGSIIDRAYQFPVRREYQDLLEKIQGMEQEPENLAKNKLCHNYEEQLMPVSAYWQRVEQYDTLAVDEALDFQDKTYRYDKEDVIRIYEALLMDIKEGNLENIIQPDYEKGIYTVERETCLDLMITFKVKDFNNYQSMGMRCRDEICYRGEGNYGWRDDNMINYDENAKTMQKVFYITTDCRHVLDILKELGGYTDI